MPISVILPGDTLVDDANYGIRSVARLQQSHGVSKSSRVEYAATTYMCGESEDDSERKAEMCVPLR